MQYLSGVYRLIEKIKKKANPDKLPVFLGEPGCYAIVGELRIAWDEFIKICPKHILLCQDDINGFHANLPVEDGRRVIGEIPLTKRKPSKSVKKHQKE